MAEFPTQHPAHTQGCTHSSSKGIHSLLALVTLVHWCGPGARCIGLLADASCLVRQPVVVKGLRRSASIDAVGGAGSGW